MVERRRSPAVQPALTLVIGGTVGRQAKQAQQKAPPEAEPIDSSDRATLKVQPATHQKVMLLCTLRGKGWTVDRVISDLVDHAPEADRIRAALGG